MNLAPIILFVYNRPWHTEQTLNALMENDLASESLLYIYCDGPEKEAAQDLKKNIEKVRNLVRKNNWCKDVEIIERTDNMGLANSVIIGVTEILEKHGKAIILEDDVLTGKHFLKFMNEALDIYADQTKVYGVTGYTFPHTKRIKDNTYFLPIMSSWGYGTWVDRWRKLDFDGEKLLKIIETNNLEFKIDFGQLRYYEMLKAQVSGKNDSWAVRFYVSMFLNNGVFLYPNKSLLKNIGFDGTGVHCSFDKSLLHEGIYINSTVIPLKKNKVLLKQEILANIKTGVIQEGPKKNKNFRKQLSHFIAPEIRNLIKRKTNFFQKQESFKKDDFPRYTEKTAKVGGQEITIPDYASFQFMYKEIFENEIYKFKTSVDKPYIIDGGANIGLASIYFKNLYPSSEIVAFEPDPEIFKILKNNIDVFNFSNIELINKGLWNQNKTMTFKSEGADAGLIAEIDQSNPGITREIEVTSLREYLNKPVDFLKLDIEGSETMVLIDIQNELRYVKRIFIEYHSFVGQKQALDIITKILIENNFRIYVSSPGLTSTSPFIRLNVYNNMDMQLNIYGFKEL